MFTSAFLPFHAVTEVDLNDESSKEESYDFRFVKWLIKEKVKIQQF